MTTSLCSYPKRHTELAPLPPGVRAVVQRMLEAPRLSLHLCVANDAPPRGPHQCCLGLGGTGRFSASPGAKKARGCGFDNPSTLMLHVQPVSGRNPLCFVNPQTSRIFPCANPGPGKIYLHGGEQPGYVSQSAR